VKSLHYSNTAGTVLYLTIPILMFFWGWLHWYLAVPVNVLLLIGLVVFLKNIPAGTDSKLPSTTEGAIAVLVVLAYLLITGHGTLLGGAGYDTPWRNAIYQDLIHFSWPIIYEQSHSALVYYLAFWMVPAAITNFFNFGVTAGNIVLVIWTYIGLRLFVFLLWDYLHADVNQVIPLTLLFLFWSGLNLIGMLVCTSAGLLPFYVDDQWGWMTWWYTAISHDGHQMAYMVRTVFDSLGNIYNQFGPLLLGTILFLRYRQLKSLAFICLLVLPYSPLGFLGLFVLMFAEAVRQIYAKVQAGGMQEAVREALSIPNVCASLSIFPVFLFYYAANYATEATVGTGNIFFAPLASYGFLRIAILLLYYLLQFGIFMVLCHKYNQDCFLFYTVLGSLLIFPFFRVGGSGDLCWNASIPGFFIVMVFFMQELLRLFKVGVATKRMFVAGALVAIMVMTPCLQISSQVRKCVGFSLHVVNVDHPGIGTTMSDKSTEQISKSFPNFANVNYKDTFFFKHLSKKS
jgi:hypothetical protein